MRRLILGSIALMCALIASASCQDANAPENARDDGGAAGSTTPPGDYMSTGHSGLGTPVNEVGADAGLPTVDQEKR